MTPEIQQGNDGKWYRKIGEDRFEETAAPAAAPSSGMLRDFVEGAAVAGGRLVDTLNPGRFGGQVSRSPGKMRNDLFEGTADTISEATSENPTRARVSGEGLGGSAISLPIAIGTAGGATVPLVASTLAGGVGGALSSDQARRMGGGGLAQFGAGLAGDIATGGLVNAAFSIPRALSAMTPTARAAEYVAPLGLGNETAEEAAMGVRSAFGETKEGVDKAYDAYRAIPSEGTTSSEPFLNLANSQKADMAFTPSEVPEVARRASKVLSEQVGVQDIERLRRGVSTTLGNQNVTTNTKRLAGQFNDVADDALQEIATQSGPDSAAAQALMTAIGKRRAMGKAFPEDSGLYDLIISPKSLSPEDAQQAFTKFVNSPDREKEIGLALDAVRSNPEAKRGLNKALVDGILNSAEETASGKVSSQLERLRKAEGVLRRVWGDDGFDHFRKLISEQATANRERGFIARYTLGINNPTKGMALGTMAGGYLGGGPGATAGMVAGGFLDWARQRLSDRAAREIAIHSLYDPDLYRQVTRPGPQGVKAADWTATMLGSLVRRGIISSEDAENGNPPKGNGENQ